jgi:hypothetical protein
VDSSLICAGAAVFDGDADAALVSFARRLRHWQHVSHRELARREAITYETQAVPRADGDAGRRGRYRAIPGIVLVDEVDRLEEEARGEREVAGGVGGLRGLRDVERVLGDEEHNVRQRLEGVGMPAGASKVLRSLEYR